MTPATVQPELTTNDDVVLAAVLERLHHQDVRYGRNWPADRDGIRLALATIQDEHREAYEAWDAGKKAGDWVRVTDEMLDVAAVVFRALRTMVPADSLATAGRVR